MCKIVLALEALRVHLHNHNQLLVPALVEVLEGLVEAVSAPDFSPKVTSEIFSVSEATEQGITVTIAPVLSLDGLTLKADDHENHDESTIENSPENALPAPNSEQAKDSEQAADTNSEQAGVLADAHAAADGANGADDALAAAEKDGGQGQEDVLNTEQAK